LSGVKKNFKTNYLPKIFFFGTGEWSKNYLKLIQSSFKNKLFISCIITTNLDYKSNFYNVENSLEKALNIYGIPDGFIICTHPKKNISIISKIIEYDKPIIIEKPITLPTDFDNLIKLFSNKNLSKIFVNHVHFYNDTFLKIIPSNNTNFFNAKIIDGSFGPDREFSPLIDWGPHVFGIISYFLENIKDLRIHKIKKINENSKNKYNLYLKISNTNETKIFSIIIGNNFSKKKRTINFRMSDNKIIRFDLNKNLPKVSPLENILSTFTKKILDVNYNTNIITSEIAIRSLEIIKIIEKKLKNEV
tara:strand:+ start:555 stop:1466 length:912 start_codon:yes stop_codon:yes gene_type:complete